MEGTKPRTASSIGMFDMLKGAGMLTIVFAHTAELYPMQAVSGLSLTAFFPFIYREALMAAFLLPAATASASALSTSASTSNSKACSNPMLTRRCSPACCTLSFIIRRSSTCPAPSASLSRSPAAFCWACPTRPSISGRSSSPAGRCGICWR